MNAKFKKWLRNASVSAGRWFLAASTAFYAVAPALGVCRCGEDCRCAASRAFAIETFSDDSQSCCGCGCCGREKTAPTETRAPEGCSCASSPTRCKATLRKAEGERENETKRRTREKGTVWAFRAADFRRENARQCATRATVVVPRARDRLYLLLSTLLN